MGKLHICFETFSLFLNYKGQGQINTGKNYVKSRDAGSSNSKQICFKYNKHLRPDCLLENGLCRFGRQHKCSDCGRVTCKALHHKSKETSVQTNVVYSNNSDSSIDTKLNQIFEYVKNRDTVVASLASKVEKVEQASQANPTGPSASQSQGGVHSTPAVVNALPSQPTVTALNLANRHILWAPVQLPLPLDSCCSLSMVSKTHTELVSQKCPNLSYKKLATPLSVSVASPDSQLQAVGIMQIPITWENGICSTFSMLVVPGLIWPILFGQNHLRQTKAITDHDGLKVTFNNPSMKFTITCGDSNPLDSFPKLFSQNSTPVSSGSTNVACLLTAVPPPPPPPPPQPRENIVLHRGFNLVTLCLVMASTLVGNPLFSTPLWLEGSSLFPGVEVVSGSIDLKSLASSPVHSQFPQFPFGKL